ncbi:tetratricopeptide repeat protein [Niveispirillum sp. SYP-B3756]|nr:tetratricopeptide repeat protein [Niveispirillum sp. SYP-B3756]
MPTDPFRATLPAMAVREGMMRANRLMATGMLGLLLLGGCSLPRMPIMPWRDLNRERAEAALAAHDYVMAQRFYEERVRDEPQDMLARYRLAEIYEKVGRPQDAERQYRVIYGEGVTDPLPLPGGMEGEPMGQAAWKQINRIRAGVPAPAP